MVARGQGRGKWEVTDNRFRVSLCDKENVLKLDGGDGCKTQWIYLRAKHELTSIVCKLCLNKLKKTT